MSTWDFQDPNEKPKNRRKWVIGGVSVFSVGAVVASYFTLIVPPVASPVEGTRGIDVFKPHMEAVQTFNTETYDEKSPLLKELLYLNGSDVRTNAVKALLGTLSYEVPQVQALDWFGNPARSPFTWEPISTDGSLQPGEEMEFSFIDYTKVNPTPEVVKPFLDKAGVKGSSDVELTRKVTDAYADYLSSVAAETPKVTVKRAPAITCEGTPLEPVCIVNSVEEDIYWDTAFFSSEEFNALTTRFSDAAATNLGLLTSAPVDVDSAQSSADSSQSGAAPESSADTPQSVSEERVLIDPNWIGASKTTEEGKSNAPKIGNGSQENPAGENTPVVYYIDEDTPYEVTLLKFQQGTDAFKSLTEISSKNRGFTLDSEVSYVYYEINVKNLSNKKLTVSDASILRDATKTTYQRVGAMYGLTHTVELEPQEEKVIQSWASSTHLGDLQLTWGTSSDNLIWFRFPTVSTGAAKPDSLTDAPSSANN